MRPIKWVEQKGLLFSDVVEAACGKCHLAERGEHTGALICREGFEPNAGKFCAWVGQKVATGEVKLRWFIEPFTFVED